MVPIRDEVVGTWWGLVSKDSVELSSLQSAGLRDTMSAEKKPDLSP